MQLNKPFIRLPYSFDAERLAREMDTLDASAWMPHPSGIEGNSAVALISRDGLDNDDFEGAMRTTPHLDQCPYTKQVIASFGEVFGRSRLMRLRPGCEVSSHVDFNYHWYTRVRIHIPIVTNEQVSFICGSDKRHMRAGECWIFDAWRRHNVVNGGNATRTHLVIDTAGSSKFWDMVEQMEQFNPGSDEQKLSDIVKHVSFESDKTTSILTENYNIAPVMSPGELDALIAAVIEDFEHNPKNDPSLVRMYKKLLLGFAKDWRQLWLLYGYQREGVPHYQNLLDSVFEQLPKDRRALVTSSNDLGVNPIVVQRILRSALANDKYDQFISGSS